MRPWPFRDFSAERPILGNQETRAARPTGSFCLTVTSATTCPFGQRPVVPGSGAAPGLPPPGRVRTRKACRHKAWADIDAVQQQHREHPAEAVALRPEDQLGGSRPGDHAGQHPPGHLSCLRFACALRRDDLGRVEADKADPLAPPGHRIAVDRPKFGRRDRLGRHPGLQARLAARQKEKGQQGCLDTTGSESLGADTGRWTPGSQPPERHPCANIPARQCLHRS